MVINRSCGGLIFFCEGHPWECPPARSACGRTPASTPVLPPPPLGHWAEGGVRVPLVTDDSLRVPCRPMASARALTNRHRYATATVPRRPAGHHSRRPPAGPG